MSRPAAARRALVVLTAFTAATVGVTACSDSSSKDTAKSSTTTSTTGTVANAVGWSGATQVLANLDDDGNRCALDPKKPLPKPATWPACLDAGDDKVNGAQDAKDLAQVTLKVPSDKATAVVTVSAPKDKARVFVKDGDAWSPLPANGAIAAGKLKQGVTLGVEARDIVRDKAVWDGAIKLTATVTDGSKTSTYNHAVTVAPLRLHTNIDAAEKVLTIGLQGDPTEDNYLSLKNEMSALAPKIPVVAVPSVGQGQGQMDSWAQDAFEWMYAEMQGPSGRQTMRYAVKTNTGKEGLDQWFRLIAPGVSVVQLDYGTEPTSGYSAGGNLEAIPAYEKDGKKYPSRPLIGGDPKKPQLFSPVMKKLLTSQGLNPIVVDTSFLQVGHVDEIVQVMPSNSARGWALAVADPTAGLALVQKLSAQKQGSVPMLDAKNDRVGYTPKTVDQVAKDASVLAMTPRAQKLIDAMVTSLKSEIGLTDADIVKVPVVFGGRPYTAKSDAEFPQAGSSSDAAPSTSTTPSTSGDDGPPPIRSGGLDGDGGIETGVPGMPDAAFAMVPNAVNGVFLSKTQAIMPKQYGPVVGGKDVFAEAVSSAYAKVGVKVGWAHNFFLVHEMGGEWHCVTNPVRTIPAG